MIGVKSSTARISSHYASDIQVSCSLVACCRRCLRCAKPRCSLCSTIFCWPLLLRSLFTPNFKSAFSFQRSFGGKPSSARNRSHLLWLLFYVSWFTDRKNVSQTVNKQISLSWIKHENGGKLYVTWKRKMLHEVTLHDVISGHEAYTFMVIKNDR